MSTNANKHWQNPRTKNVRVWARTLSEENQEEDRVDKAEHQRGTSLNQTAKPATAGCARVLHMAGGKKILGRTGRISRGGTITRIDAERKPILAAIEGTPQLGDVSEGVGVEQTRPLRLDCRPPRLARISARFVDTNLPIVCRLLPAWRCVGRGPTAGWRESRLGQGKNRIRKEETKKSIPRTRTYLLSERLSLQPTPAPRPPRPFSLGRPRPFFQPPVPLLSLPMSSSFNESIPKFGCVASGVTTTF